MFFKAAAAACFLAALATPLAAQAPAEHLRGKVKSLNAETLTLATREGNTAVVALSKDWGVVVMKPVSLEAIKPGSFIGTTEVERPEGGGQSLEVHVFPPGVKIGEGHYPWDLKPGTNMTNGTITHLVVASSGRDLDVTYPTGTRHIHVPPNVPVVETVPGERSMLKPGVSVFIAPSKTADGGFAANRVLIGEKGEAPPM